LRAKIGLPVSILLIVLFRVDHYVDRLLSVFFDVSSSLEDLTQEIKELSRKISKAKKMRVVGQDVPSALFSDYCKALKPAFQKWSNRFKTFIFGRRRFGLGPDIYYARKRSPWRLPHMQSKSLTCPSAAQQEVRMAFKRCVMAFNASDRSLSWIDKYGYGPESRNFWWKLGHNGASGIITFFSL